MDFVVVLLLAVLPAIGNFGGGLMAEVADVSRRTLSLALHAALGILFAVISLELLPPAIESARPWIPLAAFAAGGAFFVAVDRLIHVVQARFGGAAAASPWMVFFAVSMDLFSDGLMIGAGSLISVELALLLALGQVSADIPEGFATIAGFKRSGVTRTRRILIAAAFTIPIVIGATLGYWALQPAPEIAQVSLLAFTAGVLLTVSVEEIAPEAHKDEDAGYAALVLVGGFVLFALLSVYLEA